VLSNLSFVFVLISGKEWILDVHVSPLWLAVRVLGCGSMGALVWAIAGSGGSTSDIEVSIANIPNPGVFSYAYQVVNIGRGVFLNRGTAGCCIHGAPAHVRRTVTS
jgi:hypothetical protein